MIPPDDELKVKFGPDNGEVYAEVAASRLLLGAGVWGGSRVSRSRRVSRCPSNIQGTDIASIH